MKHYDVIIVGGGLVGASLALLLEKSDVSVLLVEAKDLKQLSQYQGLDTRSFTLNTVSINTLQAIGIAQALKNYALIKRVHVSKQGSFGSLRFAANDVGVNEFGWVVPADSLIVELLSQLLASKKIDIITPGDIKSFNSENDKVRVVVNRQATTTEEFIIGNLLIAADGSNSFIRRQLNYSISEYDYKQQAIVTSAYVNQVKPYTAFERFTHDGAIAMLPRGGNQYGIVWTTDNAKAQQLLALSPTAFVNELQREFGYRLGNINNLQERVSYPLKLQYVEQPLINRVLLVGNAAHTIHPIGGQGFNLCLRRINQLSHYLIQAKADKNDVGDAAILNQYVMDSKKDIQATIRFTHGLSAFCCQNWPMVNNLVGFGLYKFNMLPWMRKLLANFGMGYRNSVGA